MRRYIDIPLPRVLADLLTAPEVAPLSVDDVMQWLRHHPDGGWLQTGDGPRREAARKLLFLAWLVDQGRCSDG